MVYTGRISKEVSTTHKVERGILLSFGRVL